MLTRVLECEVMDTLDEAVFYDAMDHREVNTRFVDDFLAAHGPCRGGPILDLGTGTARIPIELCQRDPNARVLACDLSRWMLRLAQLRVEDAGLDQRIQLVLGDAKSDLLHDEPIEAVLSNSIVHHIPEPSTVLGSIARTVAPGGTVFVRDLARPGTQAELQKLVARYAGSEPPRSRELFEASLHAALTVDEVRDMLAALGIDDPDVQMTSDRHWTWLWQKPAPTHCGKVPSV